MTCDIALFPLIILCAGKAERFGSPKGLAVLGDETLLAGLCRQFRTAGGREVMVVLGYDAFVYQRYIEAELKDVAYCVNEAPERGPFSSVLTGLKSLCSAWTGAFICPVDIVAPPPQVWIKIASGLADGIAVVKPTSDGQAGHPILVARSLADELTSRCPKMCRLDELLRALPRAAVNYIEVSDPSVLSNLNMPLSSAEFKSVAR